MSGILSTLKTLRKGTLPNGCSPAAASTEIKKLLAAVQLGNRATRREAGRNLIKLQRTRSAT